MRLPEFWQFLEPGWWIVHLFATAIVYMLGMGHGRRLALRERERRDGGVTRGGRDSGPPDGASVTPDGTTGGGGR
jgi:hypothetical protein